MNNLQNKEILHMTPKGAGQRNAAFKTTCCCCALLMLSVFTMLLFPYEFLFIGMFIMLFLLRYLEKNVIDQEYRDALQRRSGKEHESIRKPHYPLLTMHGSSDASRQLYKDTAQECMQLHARETNM